MQMLMIKTKNLAGVMFEQAAINSEHPVLDGAHSLLKCDHP